MRGIQTSIALASVVLAAAMPAAANARALSFDCDTQANHYSSLTEEVSFPFEISGTVRPVELRSGNYLPVATVRIFAAPDGAGTGFQVVAASPRAERLIILSLNNKTADKQAKLGEVDLSGSVSFRLSMSETGGGTIVLDGRSFTFDADPVGAGAVIQVSCSTGQFKFSDLDWTSGGE